MTDVLHEKVFYCTLILLIGSVLYYGGEPAVTGKVTLERLDFFCEEALSVEAQDFCFNNKALYYQDYKICFSIQEKEQYHHCLHTLAQKTKDVSPCLVMGIEQKDNCLMELAQDNVNDACESVSDRAQREYCTRFL